MIGDDVVVRVLDVRGDVVRLGIDAPRSTKVHREEVYEAVREANAAAAAAVTDDAAASLAAQLSRPKPNRSAG
jgi:carbon storage regulator